MKKIFLILILLALADLLYGVMQTKKIKAEFKTYTQETLATITNTREIEQACPENDKKNCTFSLVTLSFKDNKNKENTTEVTNMGLEHAKIGEEIPVLCDTKEWVCLPKSYLDKRSSIWNNMLAVTTIKALM